MEDFEITARKDREGLGSLIEYVKKGFISKRLNYLEPKSLECICSELTLSKKEWICYSIYRSSSSQNLEVFCNKLTDSLSNANEKHENVIAMGDWNIDIGLSNGEHDKIEDFCTLFNLQSLINKETLFYK